MKKYKVKKKRNILFRFLCWIFKVFKSKPLYINLNGDKLPKKAIYLMSHVGASGPLSFELYFPIKATPWGAHEMCGKYKERWNYLYHVFYQQKLHWGKFRAFIMATLFAIISKSIYDSVGLIGTYNDARLLTSMKNSIEVLNNDMGIVIFPENSDKGYFEKVSSFHNGFISLANIYYKKTGIDLPIYNVFYSKKKNTFIVDKPLYFNQLLKEGKSVEEISNMFLHNCHALCDFVNEKIVNKIYALDEKNLVIKKENNKILTE